jgi:hypothetical protein
MGSAPRVTLESIGRFTIPADLVSETEEALQAAGRQGYERFVLWSGISKGDSFDVKTAHVPEQTAYKTPDGLLVRVPGEALHQLNVWLYDHSQLLGAQVHAHPTDAFHSHTDDTYPIVTELGSLSLVAPYFAVDGVLGRGSVAFRLTHDGWMQVPNRKFRRLIEVR